MLEQSTFMTLKYNSRVLLQAPANFLFHNYNLPAVNPKGPSFLKGAWLHQYQTFLLQDNNKQICLLHYSFSVVEISRSGSLVEPTPDQVSKQGSYSSGTCGISYMCASFTIQFLEFSLSMFSA